MMTELPVNALELDAFIDVGIDGVSVGSNDLTAKAFGLDRDWEGSGNYSGLEVRPTMLELYRMIGQTAHRRGLSYIGFCGQGVAFFPELAARLVEWHFTHIGTSPDAFEEAVINVANAEKKLGIRPALAAH
jgi:pyruvate,water dikinase